MSGQVGGLGEAKEANSTNHVEVRKGKKETEMERRVREAESETARVREGVGEMIMAYQRMTESRVVALEHAIEQARRLVGARDTEIQRLNEQLSRYRRDHVLATDLAAAEA